MKIQPSIQIPGYWARSACGHEHLFKGLTHVIIDLVVGFFGCFFFTLSASTPKWDVISVKGVKADKLKKTKKLSTTRSVQKFAIKLILGSELS